MGRVSPGTSTAISSAAVTGTVTGNQGTPNTAANAWPVQITDGTDTALVSATGALIVDATATTQPVSNAGLTELAAAINASSQMDVNIAASNATVTVTGTITANAGTNLNTSALLTTAAHDAAFGTAGSADTQVRSIQGIASMTPVQVGDNSSSLTVDNGGTFVVQENGAALTSLQLLDDAISGAGFNITQFGGAAVPIGAGLEATAVRVTLPTNGTGVVGLAAGSASIGTLGANSGVDIGDVTINNSTGASAVNIQDGGNTITVDGTVTANLAAGTNNIGDVDVLSVIPGTGATNLGKAIDTATGATDTGVLALATRDDALSALTPIEGDNVQLRTDANGALWTHDDALDAALSGSELQVDVVASLPAGTNNIGDVDILTIAAGDNNIGNVDIASIAAGNNNIGDVDIASGTVTTVTTLTGGGIAHDSADSGNPHKVGFKAFSPDGTTPGTAVAENDRTDGKADLDGRQFVNTVHPVLWSYHENSSSALTDQEVKADPGDGFSIFITDIVFSTGAATACNIFFEEGSTTILGPYYLEATAGRGLAIHFTTPKKVTASTALTVTTSAAIAHGLDVHGYVSAV